MDMQGCMAKDEWSFSLPTVRLAKRFPLCSDKESTKLGSTLKWNIASKLWLLMPVTHLSL